MYIGYGYTHGSLSLSLSLLCYIRAYETLISRGAARFRSRSLPFLQQQPRGESFATGCSECTSRVRVFLFLFFRCLRFFFLSALFPLVRPEEYSCPSRDKETFIILLMRGGGRARCGWIGLPSAASIASRDTARSCACCIFALPFFFFPSLCGRKGSL